MLHSGMVSVIYFWRAELKKSTNKEDNKDVQTKFYRTGNENRVS